MESNIVRDFKNLRVFAKHNLISMDELVHDLTTALEETASGNNLPEGALSKRYIKKRRGIRRTQSSWKSRGTISEASESSIDEQQGCDIAGSIAHSDSDDLVSSHRFSKLVMPIVDTVPLIESDSFTENLSPMRPQRRRRKFKSMAVDSSPLTDHGPSDVDLIPSTDKLHIHKHSDATSSMFISDRLGSSEDQHSSATSAPSYSIMSGKRKRSTKCKVDYSSPQAESTLQTMSKAILDRMEVTSISQESSLSSSEFDSDINVNNEDAREADDEQSDFFHEPGPACGIPDIVPWWENERVTDKPLRVNSDFEKILTGTFEHLPKYGSQSFKAKVGKLVSGAGREIRLGRRKLKGKMPRYTVGRFLQDREHWSRLQDPHHSYPSMAASSNITISTNNNNNNNNNVASNNNNGNSSNNNNNNNSNNNNNNGNSNNNNNNNGNSNNNNSGPQAGEFKKRRHVQRNCVGEGSPLAIEGSSMDSKPSSHRTSLCTTVSKSSSSPTIPRRRSSRKTGSSSVSDS